MAHELDTRKDGTVGAMFAVGETPWHGLGQVLAQPPKSVDEALAAAGLDWEVDLKPALYEVAPGETVEVEDAHIIVRTDRNRALGVVGSIYKPLQNRSALETMQPLIEQGLASWESAGSLFHGRKVWALIRLNLDSKLIRKVYGPKGENVKTFEILLNRHDGHGKIVLAETDVRVVCNNTCVGAEHEIKGAASTQRVTHDQSVDVNMVKATEELWADLVSRHEALARQVVQLRRTRLDEKLFRSLVLNVALPIPTERKSTDLAKKLLAGRIEKVEAKREILHHLWIHGMGQSGDMSAYEAFNAVTEAADHDRGVWTQKGLGQFMPGGSLQTIKADVKATLLAYANDANKGVALTV
jgi:phage/plasmid-like protein (TIGR03299 family)